MEEKKKSKNLAKKDFIINQNDVFISIKKGEDLDKLDIPSRFNETLKTEKVI